MDSILDLRPINRALGKRPFRMLTLKQILAQICPGDWFASVDLKDAYFHIQIAPHHRWFSEVCCQGKAQRTNTLALAPRTFQSASMQHFPTQIEWKVHPQLSGRLADFSSIPGYAYQPHRLAAYSLGVPRAMCQHAEEHSHPKSGRMFSLCGDESPPFARSWSAEELKLVAVLY